MKHSTFALALLPLSGALAQPHRQHQHPHLHQRHHEKRDVVWVTDWEIVTETLNITTTIWVDGDVSSVPSTATTSHVLTTSTTSTTQSPAEFHESPTLPPQPSSTSVFVAPSAPAAPTSTSVAQVVDPTPSPVYVPPTTTEEPYIPPAATTAAPAQATTASSSSSSSSYSGVCSSESPCTGDLTFYTAGLGACGYTNDGNVELVVALPHALMGPQSNDNPYCGKTITVTHDTQSIVVKIVDKCMGCDGYSIDLSNKAFSSLGIDFSVGRTTGTWYFND